MASEQLHFLPYELRRGKPPVINDLAQEAMAMQPAGENHVLVLTDASVILEPDTLFHLVKHYKNKQIGVVDAFMHSAGLRQEGISQSEHRYMSGEVQLKWAEGRLWVKIIGPFGGCYALRSDLFEPVPPNSLVDDFYLVFRALEKDYSAINEPLAVCTRAQPAQVAMNFGVSGGLLQAVFKTSCGSGVGCCPLQLRLVLPFFRTKYCVGLAVFFC